MEDINVHSWQKMTRKGRKTAIYQSQTLNLGAIFILRKGIGVGGWSRKWQFSLTLCSKNVLT